MHKLAKFTMIALALTIGVGVFFVLDAELFNHALAAEDVFSKGTEKGNEIAELMKGKIAITITGLVIGVCAIMMQLGRLNHMIGVRVIMGAFVLGSCMGIAEFLYA